MSNDKLQINDTELTISRPHSPARELRGWDAADELLIEQAVENLKSAENGGAEEGQRLLIIDDQFGALTLGLRDFAPVTVADSATLTAALQLNDIDASVAEVPASWLAPPGQSFDLVVMRIPRHADYLAWLLRWVNQRLSPSGRIVAGGMIKHLPDRSAAVFQALVDTQTVCPARKKARVIIANPGTPTLDGWADLWRGYPLPDSGRQVDALPAVFSRRKLDIGTRELLPFVRAAASELQPGSRVLDLACGNGVLGLAALDCRPDLHVSFSDVSSQALLSARRNVEQNADWALPGLLADFFHCDGVPDNGDGYDLILLNPPFHEGGVVGDHIALRLFEASSRALAPSGRLLMVGNRHLGYHRTLKHSFKRVRQLAASSKFLVFEADCQDASRP